MTALTRLHPSSPGETVARHPRFMHSLSSFSASSAFSCSLMTSFGIILGDFPKKGAPHLRPLDPSIRLRAPSHRLLAPSNRPLAPSNGPLARSTRPLVPSHRPLPPLEASAGSLEPLAVALNPSAGPSEAGYQASGGRMNRKRRAQWNRRPLVEENLHASADSRSAAASCSRTPTACSRVTPGKQARKSSRLAPSLRFSNNARSGTRVPRKTHAPLTRPGRRSTAGQVDQSIMARLPRIHRSLRFGGLGLMSVLRGCFPGLGHYPVSCNPHPESRAPYRLPSSVAASAERTARSDLRTVAITPPIPALSHFSGK